MAKKRGDNRLSVYAKQLRIPMRRMLPDTPYYQNLLRRVWAKLVKFGEPDKPVHLDLVWALLPENKRVITQVVEMLDQVGRVRFNREKELISVIFPEKK